MDTFLVIASVLGAVAFYIFMASFWHTYWDREFEPQSEDDKGLIVLMVIVWPLSLVYYLGYKTANWAFKSRDD